MRPDRLPRCLWQDCASPALMRPSTCMLYCILACCMLLGCREQKPVNTVPQSTVIIAPTVYVFSTGEKPPEELVFAVKERELYLEHQDTQGKVKSYLVKEVPEEVMAKITPWFGKQQTAMRMENSGEIKSNGPLALTLHTVQYNAQSTEHWSSFITDAQLTELLSSVKALAIHPDQAVEEPPIWITNDSRVKVDFASQKKALPDER